MLVSEAEWVGSALLALPPEAFPVLHIGSSSEEFRIRQQPWVDQRIFKRLRQQGRRAVHTDIRNEGGVDIVADITDPKGMDTLRRVGAGVVLCANLLEHVTTPQSVLDQVSSLVPPSGYLLVTCPRRYPLHPDPIDTGFRPSVQELARMVGSDFSIVDAAELTCRRIFFYFSNGHPGRLAVRLLLPVYRPRSWIHLARWSWRRPVQSVVLLQRQPSSIT